MRHFVAAIVFVAVAASSPAQCFGDDGFSIPGTCCTPVLTSNLPSFPPYFMAGDGACIADCGIQSQFGVFMNLGAPIQIFDDLYVSFLTIGGGITTAPSALVIMKYARTWMEAGPTGVVHQVWRFLVNTELQYTPPGPAPCPVPTCATQGLTVHFVGSIDYSAECNPANPNWTVAMNLTHLCGDMAHGPFSSKPTNVNHPARLYALVGPAPFNFAATAPLPGGIMLGDSMRSTFVNLGSGTWITHSEVPIFAGQSPLVTNDCACSSIATAPPRWERRLLRFDYDCIAPPLTSLNAIPWAPIAPTGFNVFPLGTYANPFAYPGGETVSVCFGVASAPDTCGLNLPIHLLHGVASQGGFPMFHFNSALPPNFDIIDVENQYVLNFAGPSMSLGYGAYFLSTMIWSGNW